MKRCQTLCSCKFVVMPGMVENMQRGQVIEADVVVIGAGPTGLMLATELRLRGVNTIVIEKLQTRSEFGKALNIQPRTAEILDLRGLLANAREKAEGGIPGSH